MHTLGFFASLDMHWMEWIVDTLDSQTYFAWVQLDNM